MIQSIKQIKTFTFTKEEINALEIVHKLFKDISLLPEYIVDGDGGTLEEVFENELGDFDEIENVIEILEILVGADCLTES